MAELETFVTNEHVDINIMNSGGDWSLGARNSDAFPAIQYQNDEVVMYVGSPALMTRPADSSFDFIGVPAGETFHLLPQSQNPDVLYLGFAGYGLSGTDVDSYDATDESKGRVGHVGKWARATLTDVRHFEPDGSVGSGHFSLWQSGVFGGANVFMSSYDDGLDNPNGNGLDVTDGISSDDAMWILSGGHAHYNFGFTEVGRYEIDLMVSAYFGDNGLSAPNLDGYSQSEPITVYFSVESAGQLELEAASYEVDEAAGSVSIDVIRVGGSDGRITVDYATSDGTATAGDDYTTTSGTLEFLDGETRKTITIPILDDSEVEENETFSVTLSSPEPENLDEYIKVIEGDTNGLLGATTTATVVIFDNDGNVPPSISEIDDAFVIEGDSTGLVPFTVGDAETAVGDLIVTATSSNQAVIPDGNIMLGGSGADRTIEVLSILDQIGSSTITVTVTDAGGLQASETFDLAVTANGLVPFAMPSLLEPGTGVAAGRSVMGDFNGDGVPDIITGGSREEQMGYRQGVGDGSFLDERLLNLGNPLRATGFDSIDYDGDGDLDLLVVEYDTASPEDLVEFVLYRNDGTASFTRTVLASSSHPSQGFFDIHAGDLNGNGRVDLMYLKGGREVAYALQQADGTFGEEVVLLASSTTVTPKLGDIDGDGDLDIVVGNRADSVITVFRNDGAGVFSGETNVPTGSSLSVLKLADVNNDGRLDVVTRESGTNLGYYPQLSDGAFGSRVNLLPGLTSINQVEVADLNSDGIADLVVTRGGARDGIMLWSAGLGEGNFADPVLIDPLQGSSFGIHVHDLDGDTHPDIVSMGNLILRPSPIAVHINKTGENPMEVLPPTALDYVIGDPIEVGIFFGFPIEVTGNPRIALQMGDDTVFADYVGGSGTPTLRFVHTVTATDLDLDGVQLASNLIDLNGGTLTDPIGGAGMLEFPNMTFVGVLVNGRGPFVQSITRGGPTRSTDADTVQFHLEFAEPVTDVDATDLEVVMNAGDLTGAAIVSVTGSGSTYEVTVATGTGSGTLGLSVIRGAEIFDLDGDILAKDFVGGEVYTVRRDAIGEIDTYYLVGHADYSIQLEEGEFDYILIPDTDAMLPDAEYPSEAVYAYADSTARLTLPTEGGYEFTGVAPGEPIYVLSAVRTPSTPWLGLESDVERQFLAPYVPDDPRVTGSASEYLKMQLVDMRSSSDGQFSLYRSDGNLVTGAPTVFMTTVDGIQEDDAIYLSSGSHIHRNLTFSKPGMYELDFVFSGFVDSNRNGVFDPIIDTYIESGIKTIVVNVDTLGARDDEFAISGQGMLHGSVTLNDDWDEAFGAFSATVDTTTSKGELTLQPNGSFTYQPSPAFDGTDSFTYRLTNDRGGFTTATVTISGSTRPDFDTLLREGHVDIGVNFEDEAWDLHIHDEETEAEYEPNEAELYVGMDGLTVRQGDSAHPAYDFLGVNEGETFFLLPETEDPELLFLGVGAEELESGIFLNDEVTLQLQSMSGPGYFSMWQSGLTVDTPNLLLATSDGVDATDQLMAVAGGHGHINFAFTEQGFYEITFIASGTTVDGQQLESEPVTYYFRVGNHLPVASDDSFVVDKRGVVFGNILFNDMDADGDALEIELGSNVLQGELTLHPNGAFEYRPFATFAGIDTFSYSISDKFGGVATATVTIESTLSKTFEATLTQDHVDIGIAVEEDGETGELAWDLHIHDEESDMEYHPDEARLYVGMASERVREGDSAGSEFDFLGVEPGESFYLLPATEDPALLYLGFGTEEIAEGTLRDESVTLRLKNVSGPGHFAVWDTTVDGIELLMATWDGVDSTDRIVLPEGSHSHFNLSFSAVGLYEVTVQAEGLSTDGNVITGEEATYYFQVGNHMDAIDVAGGQQQRSFIRNLDVVFADDDSLTDLLEPNRMRFTQYDLNGENGFDVLDPVRRPTIDIVDNVMQLDWGTQGIGGNRSTMLGDGYYRLSFDFDGDGEYDQDMFFFRLFGDVNGDGQVTSADIDQINTDFGSTSGESDVNGDRRVNGIDRLLASRSLGRKLADGLGFDD